MTGISKIMHRRIQFNIPYLMVMVIQRKLANIHVDMLSKSGCLGVYVQKHRNDVAGQKRSIHQIVTTGNYIFILFFFHNESFH